MDEPLWYLTKDGDVSCLALYRRHYSALRNKAQRKVAQFVGPGQHIVLRTERADALFVWRRFIDDSGQHGVNCAVFRNEGPPRTSSGSNRRKQASAMIAKIPLPLARWIGATFHPAKEAA